MIPVRNLKVLAETAFASKNYKEAYSYYSQLLEQELDDGEVWIKKGLSSGLISTNENMRLDECIYLIKHGIEVGVSADLRKSAADKLIDVYEHTIRVLNGALAAAVSDHQKMTMPEGGSRLVHMGVQAVKAINSAKDQAEAKVRALDLMILSVELDDSRDNYIASLNAINGLLIHSARSGNYLAKVGVDGALEIKVKGLKEKYCDDAIRKYPDLKEKLEAVGMIGKKAVENKSGCFIATAAMGSCDHPKVLILREFRDDVLLTFAAGRKFVEVYYRFSPFCAGFVARSSVLKVVVRYAVVSPLSGMCLKVLRRIGNRRSPGLKRARF